MSIRPTGLGVKAALFYGVLAGAFFAAPYANLFFLLIVFLTVLGCLGALATIRNVSGVTAGISPPEPAPAGTGPVFFTTLDAGRRTRFALELELTLEGRKPVRTSIGAVTGKGVLEGRFPPLPRGIYPVRRVRLVSCWPLGIVKAGRVIAGPDRIVIYPAPVRRSHEEGNGGAGEQCAQSAQTPGFLQPSGIREYLPGDELRSIHWKASARRGELVVTEWEGGAGEGLEVLLDRRAEPFEEALSLLASFALSAAESKEALKVQSQGFSGTFGVGHEPIASLLEFLAGAEKLGADGPPPPPVSPGVLRLPAAAGRSS